MSKTSQAGANPSRRSTLRFLAAAPAAAIIGGAALTADAALLAWKPVHEQAAARFEAFVGTLSQAEQRYFNAKPPRLGPAADHVQWAQYAEACDRAARAVGYHRLAEQEEAEAQKIYDVEVEIAEIPARTIEGLKFKAAIAKRDDNHDMMRAIVADLLSI